MSLELGVSCTWIDVIASFVSGRLVRERIGPAMLSAVQIQGIKIDLETNHFVLVHGGSFGA
ncbi:hypothetical protein HN51_047525 [Arachis hypogaea]